MTRPPSAAFQRKHGTYLYDDEDDFDDDNDNDSDDDHDNMIILQQQAC